MTKNELFQLITEHTKNVVVELKEHEITQTDSLRELGANSVDRAEILTLTMESIGLDIPRTELFGARNISDLVDIFYCKISKT